MKLLELLREPPRGFSAMPFWFLNGDLRRREIRHQLEDFAVRGVYGVVLHPRMGLPRRIEYLGPSFFGYIRFAVETAAALDMKIVLYDEGMYPSGSASGKVAEGRPDLLSQGIALVLEPEAGDEVLVRAPSGVLVARKSGGTMRGLHRGEDDGERGAPPTADILNPEAVRRFISLTHEAYYRELKEYFGSVIIGIFTDEPDILGRNVSNMFPWTHGFASLFVGAGGSLAGLSALFSGEENRDTALYRRMIREREGTVYYGALSRWCEEHDIALMGHPQQSDDIAFERYFHVPGQDLVLRKVAPEKGGLSGMDTTMAKCSADAAAWEGRRRNSNECFGACNRGGNPWQLSGADLKWYTDWLAVRGVNMLIPHAFYYSIAGDRKNERPPDVGPHSIWWPRYLMWSRYWSRLCFLMTDAALHAEVAVPCRNRALRADDVKVLFTHQTGFRYLPESLWSECSVRDGALYCRGRRFTAVLGEPELFPGVPRYSPETVAPDFFCFPACGALRAARFTRCDVECFLLVNEGDDILKTVITLPSAEHVGRYDLWRGEAAKMPHNATPRGAECAVEIPVRGSLLLFSCTASEYAALPALPPETPLPTPQFTLASDDAASVRKTYTARLYATKEQALAPRPTLTVRAEEEAELSVNGRDAGAGFWAPQVFDLAGLLREGENDLTLTVTGSLANLYGKQSVPYGLL